ncbi:MAG: hypothetical protein O7G85_06230 [Planctomycetota bacterium]|nr:hypothetical protein [Planctomycetota bacterium]
MRTPLFLASILILHPLATPLLAQGSCDEPVLGTNLARVLHYQTQIPFVDVFTSARTWFSQQVPHGAWDTGEPIATDANGWVTSLAPGQAVATIMLTEQGGNYPAGQYICLYDGEGTLEFRQNASIVSQQPGRIVVQIDPTTTGLSWMRITQTNPANYLRNIRLIMPGFEATYETQVFHPSFLESLEPYGVIRFMDWQNTNHSDLVDWDDRTKVTNYTMATDSGVALEHMVALCNRVGASPWFCIPHLATDDFITQFATYVRDNLDPSLHVYIEHSNEVWNSVFQQHSYVKQAGLARGLSTDSWDAGLRYHAAHSVEIFQIWEGVWGGTDRLVRVIAGWSATPGVNITLMDWDDAYLNADALATAPYFGGGLGLTVPQTEAMSIDELLDVVQAKLEDPTQLAATMASNTNQAMARGLRHITYEGGQGLVNFGQPDNDTLTSLYVNANRSPRMGDLYDTYLSAWRANSNADLFVHYLLIRYSSESGSWGSMESQMQDPSTAYKWQALQDYSSTHCSSPADIDGDGVVGVNDLLSLLSVWDACVSCPEDLDGNGQVDVFDLLQLLADWS